VYANQCVPVAADPGSLRARRTHRLGRHLRAGVELADDCRSGHEDALPLIVTHGWPGSVIEQLKIIEPLTDPTAHGASGRTRSIW
jgi:hypothetical protein